MRIEYNCELCKNFTDEDAKIVYSHIGKRHLRNTCPSSVTKQTVIDCTHAEIFESWKSESGYAHYKLKNGKYEKEFGDIKSDKNHEFMCQICNKKLQGNNIEDIFFYWIGEGGRYSR